MRLTVLGLTRAESSERVRRLVESGMTVPEAATELGVGRSAASSWLCDPDGAKQRARRASYAGNCLRCGAPTSGCNGIGQAPRFCRAHNPSQEQFWTQERVVQAIRKWHETYGQPPAACDWNVSPSQLARRTPEAAKRIVDRWEAGYWPHVVTVIARFGSWSAAISAAGLTPRKRGGRGAQFGTSRRQEEAA